MGSVETTDIHIRVLGPPKYDRHGNHEVPVMDNDGRISDLRVWSQHHDRPGWRVGSTYYLEDVKQNPPKSNKARYETSSAAQITRYGRPCSPDMSLLHVSDTHLGRNRTDKDLVGEGDQVDRFLDIVNIAIKYRVDGILHTGDIFDDEVTDDTIEIVKEHVSLLHEAGITIYYVRGHHGCDKGDALLQSQGAAGRMVHLSNNPQILGGGALALYGIDAEAASNGFSQTAPSGDAPEESYRLLAWHEAVEPLARDGVPLEKVATASAVDLDGLALGDLHRSKRAYIDHTRKACGQRLRMFYAGATTNIARNADGYEPAVWLLQIADRTLERHRIEL